MAAMRRGETPAPINRPRATELLTAALADADKERAKRTAEANRNVVHGIPGLLMLGNTPAERRSARIAQLTLKVSTGPQAGVKIERADETYERIARRELARLREEAKAKPQPTKEEIVRHEAFVAAEAAEAAEENRKRIAKANRSKFTKDEHKRRYGKDVRYRDHPQGMKDMTKEEDKRSFLKSVHDDFIARGGVIRPRGDKSAVGDGAISMFAFATERSVSTETMRQYLLTWEALLDIHDRTGRWVQVRRARYAVAHGWRAGDPFPFPDKVMKEDPPKDLVDKPKDPYDFNKVDLAGEEAKPEPPTDEKSFDVGPSKMTYSAGYKRRHPNQ